MLNRRRLIAGVGTAALLAGGPARVDSFQDFLAGVSAEARRNDISQATLRLPAPIRISPGAPVAGPCGNG